MPTIDDKVVAMSFESSKFESGVNATITALDKLKAALKFENAGKGLDEVNAAGKRVDLSHISRGVDDIRGKLEVLKLVGIGVLTHLANLAIDTGGKFLKSLTIDPIIQGFQEYATTLNSVQTILANTQASGATLGDVNKALQDLNHYSDLTIYNFSQMAKNIGTFTAAGVDLKTSTEAIKGIANLAALSGSSADQAATAMYQLSQAISAGQVHLQDWNSVVNAGMGGTVFQRALATTAENMGKIKEGSLKLVGPMKNVQIAGESFRQSLQSASGKTWLTSDVLTNTLKQFTGDMTDAQLAAEGFTAEQIKAIQQTAITAQHAATEVKTIAQVFDVAREAIGSGWGQTFALIFGNFGEAKTTFTALSNAINGFINVSANARNKVIGDWKELGGRTVLINSIEAAFHNLMAILAPIRDAFREIFPAKTGKDLIKLTYEFKHLADALKPGPQTIENLKRTFAGLFALLDIGKQIIGGIFTVFGQLFGVLGDGSGGFLNFTGSIGDWLVSVDKALKKGNALHNFFVGLGNILAAPIQLLEALAHALSGLFAGFSPGGLLGQIDGITKGMTPFQKVMQAVATAWGNLMDSIMNSGDTLQPIFDAIVNFIQGLGTAIGTAASGMNFEAILQAIRTGLLGGIFLIFRNFMKQLSGGHILGGSIIKNISGSFNALQNSLQSLQHNIQADTLKKIAISIALLTASVVALSFINPEKLKSAIVALGFMFAELLTAMKIMDKISSGVGFVKLPFIAASLILIAGAIDVLSLAVIALSRLSWNDLLKGLTGVGVLLGVISVAVIPLSANSAGMVRAGIGITAIAIAMKILASAVADFGAMNWTEMGKGLTGVTVGLLGIAGAMQLMPRGMAAQSVALVVVASALKILASAVSTFGAMDWHVMGKGLAGISGALVAIAVALQLMPKNMVLTATGLLIVSVALGKISDAIGKMGAMPIRQLEKGLIGLAGALTILSVALYAMSGTFAGAAALAIAAAGLALFIPAIIALGKQSWTEILKGLVTLAAALTILGIAGALITPVIPSLLGLGAALILIGAGLALAGAGIALIGLGLSALVVAAPTGVAVLVAALEDLVKAIPEIVQNAVTALLAIVKGLAIAAPQFVDALVKILDSLVEAIIKSTPKIAQAFEVLLAAALQVIRDKAPSIVQTGFDILIALLKGVRDNIGQVVTAAVQIVTAFLGSIASNLGKILTAGAQILLTILKGIASAYVGVVTAALNIISSFLGTIASNLGRVATAGLNILLTLLKAIAGRIGDVIRMGSDIIVNFVTGIGNAGPRIVASAVSAITKFINAIVKGALALVNAGAIAIVNFLNGIAAAIDQHAPEIRAAGVRIGIAIADGMTFGMASKATSVAQKAADLGRGALGAIAHAVGAKSPSVEAFKIGQFIVIGLANGMAKSDIALISAAGLANGVINKFNEVLKTTSSPTVMQTIGQSISQGFAQGIRGSTDDITSAFGDLNQKLLDAMTAAKTTIATEQKKLDDLLKAKKPDLSAIKEAQKAISENEAILKSSTLVHTALVTTLKNEGIELLKLTTAYDKITEKLKTAQDVLANAIQTRDDAIKGFSDQFSTLPDLVTTDANGDPVDQLSTYIGALTNQANAVASYQSTLDQLRKLGLDDATYQKLLSEGTADQEFATQLLSGGKTAVDGLNTLDKQLQTVSKTLATNAGNNLYQAGVDAAQGLVNGLESKKSAIRKTMEAIARDMINALKKELKIKSPSEEFADIGRYSMEGMAKGFSDSSTIVSSAVDDAAKEALTAMQRNMRDISNVITEELNPNPVITPILDLSQIKDQAQNLVIPITAAASFGQASVISSEQTAAQAEVDSTVTPGGTSVKFEQNNYSPEALTEIEIYRQTRNQLSQLKSVLAT